MERRGFGNPSGAGRKDSLSSVPQSVAQAGSGCVDSQNCSIIQRVIAYLGLDQGFSGSGIGGGGGGDDPFDQ